MESMGKVLGSSETHLTGSVTASEISTQNNELKGSWGRKNNAIECAQLREQVEQLKDIVIQFFLEPLAGKKRSQSWKKSWT